MKPYKYKAFLHWIILLWCLDCFTALSLHFLKGSPSVAAQSEPSVCLQQLYPSRAEVSTPAGAPGAAGCVCAVCVGVWLGCVGTQTPPVVPPRQGSFSSRRGWQRAVKMIDSGCLFYSRAIPTQHIYWSFCHGFSPASTSGVSREGEEKLELIC